MYLVLSSLQSWSTLTRLTQQLNRRFWYFGWVSPGNQPIKRNWKEISLFSKYPDWYPSLVGSGTNLGILKRDWWNSPLFNKNTQIGTRAWWARVPIWVFWTLFNKKKQIGTRAWWAQVHCEVLELTKLGYQSGYSYWKEVDSASFQRNPISCILFHSQKKLMFSQFISLHIGSAKNPKILQTDAARKSQQTACIKLKHHLNSTLVTP